MPVTALLSIVAIVGLIIFVVGAILWIATRPSNARYPLIMVIGLLVWAIAAIISSLIALF